MRKRKYAKLRDGTRARAAVRGAAPATSPPPGRGRRRVALGPAPPPPRPGVTDPRKLPVPGARDDPRSHAASSEPAGVAAARAGGARGRARGLARLRPCARDGAVRRRRGHPPARAEEPALCAPRRSRRAFAMSA